MGSLVVIVLVVIGAFFVFRKSVARLSGCLSALAVPLLLLSFCSYIQGRKDWIDLLPFHMGDVLHGVDAGAETANHNYDICVMSKMPMNLRPQANQCGVGTYTAQAACLTTFLDNNGEYGIAQICRQNTQLGSGLAADKEGILHRLLCSALPFLKSCAASPATTAPSGSGGVRTDNAYLECEYRYLQGRKLNTNCGTQPKERGPALDAWSQCTAAAIQSDVPPRGNGPAYMQKCNEILIRPTN
ncbi:MAG TPA: hypothetical protein VGO37_18695 [Steroidobacteraceae bacterium]|jgi:hypothetical protein|nr:hypothetical protein [Steroidobacteraceae bacterium]